MHKNLYCLVRKLQRTSKDIPKMRSPISTVTSLLLLATLSLSWITPLAAGPDEGLFTPDQIAALSLKARGRKIRPDRSNSVFLNYLKQRSKIRAFRLVSPPPKNVGV